MSVLNREVSFIIIEVLIIEVPLYFIIDWNKIKFCYVQHCQHKILDL